MTTSTYSCPLCNELLNSVPGTVFDTTDGVTLFCNGHNCPANENVQGHGKNEASAFDIIKQKYRKTI